MATNEYGVSVAARFVLSKNTYEQYVTTRGQFPKISLITVNFSAIQLSIFWHSTHNY